MINAHLMVMMVHGIQKVNIVQCNNYVKQYAYTIIGLWLHISEIILVGYFARCDSYRV